MASSLGHSIPRRKFLLFGGKLSADLRSFYECRYDQENGFRSYPVVVVCCALDSPHGLFFVEQGDTGFFPGLLRYNA
jgi:hypothetical protein